MADEVSVWEAILLGILQGVTEWLPVSSSGHLVLARAFLGVEVPLFFDLMLHVATLSVVVVYYRRSLGAMLRAVARAPAAHRTSSWRAVGWSDPDRRLAGLLVIGTIPVVVAALLWSDFFEGLFDSVAKIGVAFLLMGVWLFSTRWARVRRPADDLRLSDALWVGLSQVAAIAPGISRSGMTVGAALHRGLDRETAVRYSFLLSIPTIIGAALFQATGGALEAARADLRAYLAGTVAAAVFGYITLVLLVRLVKQGHLSWFAPYAWAVGAAVLLHAW